MITSPKNFIEQFQNFIEHIAGVMKTFLTKEVADNYYLGKSEKASSASSADTATKATQDANGNVIPETYATKSELTSGLATKQPVGDYRTKSELDSIYLGINAKAKSAETADLANSISGTAVLGKVGLTGGAKISSSANPYVAPQDLLVSATAQVRAYSDFYGKIAIYVDGSEVASKTGSTSSSYQVTYEGVVKAGAEVRARGFEQPGNSYEIEITDSRYRTLAIEATPISLYAISEEDSE